MEPLLRVFLYKRIPWKILSLSWCCFVHLQKHKKDLLESPLMPNASQGWTWISWGSLSVVHNLTTGYSTFHCSWETCALFRNPSYRGSSSIWGLVFNLLSFPSPFFSVIVTKPENFVKIHYGTGYTLFLQDLNQHAELHVPLSFGYPGCGLASC